MTEASSVPAVPLEQRARSWIDMVKDSLSILRDLFLFVLILVLIFDSGGVAQMLQKRGINSISAFGIDWKSNVEVTAQQSLSAGGDTQNAKVGLQEVKANLQRIADGTDPKAAAMAKSALEILSGSIAQLDTANHTLANSYLTQQSLLNTAKKEESAASATAAPARSTAPASQPAATTALEGWIYIGESDKDLQNWTTPPAPKVSAQSPNLKAGDTVTLTDDLFVRAGRTAGQTFNQTATLGALRAGTTVQVEEVQQSHALNGGVFLWIRVRANQ